MPIIYYRDKSTLPNKILYWTLNWSRTSHLISQPLSFLILSGSELSHLTQSIVVRTNEIMEVNYIIISGDGVMEKNSQNSKDVWLLAEGWCLVSWQPECYGYRREDSSENTEKLLVHLELRNWIFELILLCNFAQWSRKYRPTSLYFLVFQKWSKVSCIGPPNSLPLINGEWGLSDVFNLHSYITVHALHYQSCPYCQQENLQQL